MRLVPVDPDSNLVNAMRAGAYGLKRGKVLVLYPEGERSIDGSPKVFKKGAAILSAHLQVPIVPVALDGFFEIWPRGKYWFQRWRGNTRITFGKPMVPTNEPPSEQLYQQLTTELKQRVRAMWEEQERELHPPSAQAMAAD
jgi:long-chain acyl-CoA synthetase